MSACGQVSRIHFKHTSHDLKRVLVSLVCRTDVAHNMISVFTLNASVFLHSESRLTGKFVTMERLALVTLSSPHLLHAERKNKLNSV